MAEFRAGVLVVAVIAAALVLASPAGSADAPVPVVRIDAGGAGAPGSPAWQADSAAAPNPLGNGAAVGAAQVRSASGPVSLADPSVPAGTPAAVFATVRADWQARAPNLTWRLPATSARAGLRLYFAELDDSIRAGGRVFDVLVEGVLVDDDLDVVARTGGVRRALVRSYDVVVVGGTVDVQLRGKTKPPAIAGLELLETPPMPPPLDAVPMTRVDAGGAGVADTPPWEPDTAAQPSPRSNVYATGPTKVTTTSNPIDMSGATLPPGTPVELFRTIRTDSRTEQPNLSYVLHVPGPGTYGVRLYFVEVNPSWVGATSRVQDVKVDGVLVDDDLDLAARAGGALKAFTRTYTVSTTKHAIQVELAAVRHPIAVAALELLASPASPVDLPGAWTDPVASSPQLGEDGMVALDGYLYRAGGQIFLGYLRVVSTSQHDRYDPRTGEWTALPPLPVAVDHVQAVTHQGRVWYLGGMTGGPGTGAPRGPSGQLVSYDPATGAITTHTAMPRPRGAGGIAVVAGRIYYFGGFVASNQTSAQADVYDIATDTWSQLPDLPVAKDHFKAAVIGQEVHIPGGRAGTAASTMTRHDVYDTVTDTYRTAAPLPLPLGGAGLAVLDGRLIMAGGETRAPDAARHDVFGYDPVTDAWTALEPMHTPRHGLDLTTCGNAVYVAAGMGNFGASNVNATIEAYTLDGSPPDCPLTAPPAVVARARIARPSVLEAARKPSVRRVAARGSAVGAGVYCSI